VTTPIVVTVDDTHLHPQSLTRLVLRLTTAPQGQHVSACAAALIAENPLATFVTRMQQWDYRLGINGVKRMQAAYNTALVAQGAFSAHRTSDLRGVGGWPDAIGEDIVLTWAMLGSRGLVQYEPLAVGFTVVPERLGRLLSQRSRWARGMLEAFGPIHPRDSLAPSRRWSPGSTTSSRVSTSVSSSSGCPAFSSSSATR
jgi:biofilm PGA synthesis N-glycosyltransferase PgaC